MCCQLLVTWVPVNVEVKLLVIPWYKQKLITCCFHSNTFGFEARSLDIKPNVTQKSLLSGSTIKTPNDNFFGRVPIVQQRKIEYFQPDFIKPVEKVCCAWIKECCFEARSLDTEPNVTQKSVLSGSSIKAPNEYKSTISYITIQEKTLICLCNLLFLVEQSQEISCWTLVRISLMIVAIKKGIQTSELAHHISIK